MKLIILGAGGYGRTVVDMVKQSGKYSEMHFLDDNSTDEQVIGKCLEFRNYISSDIEIYLAFGNNEVRLQWMEKIEVAGGTVPTIIHNTAYVSPEAIIEHGCVVLPKAIINTNVTVKCGCIINCGAIVDHGYCETNPSEWSKKRKLSLSNFWNSINELNGRLMRQLQGLPNQVLLIS